MKAFQLPLPLYQSEYPLTQNDKLCKVHRMPVRKARVERKSAPERLRRAV